MTSRTGLTTEPLDVAALFSSVARPANGALIVFLGTVREVNDGRAVSGIEYSAYEAMAASELDLLAAEASERFGSTSVRIVHRLGTLTIEDVSVGIAVGHAHRAEAYAMSRWILEELKRRVPVWKREHYVDGTREWVDPTTANMATNP